MALSGSPVWQSCLELDHLKGWGLDEPSLGLLTVVKIISGNSEDFSRFFFFLFLRIYFFPRRPPWDIPREYLKILLRRCARSVWWRVCGLLAGPAKRERDGGSAGARRCVLTRLSSFTPPSAREECGSRGASDAAPLCRQGN